MIDWNEAAEDFFEHEKSLSRHPNSVKRKRSEIKWLFSWLRERGHSDLAMIAEKDLVSCLAYLKNERKLATSTLASAASMMRTFFRYLEHAEIIPFSPARALPAPKRRYGLPKAVLTHEEIKRLLDSTPPKSLRSLRDRAILELMYSSALRRAEVHHLDLNDLDIQNRRVHIREGKGLKDRVIPIGKTAIEWVERYLTEGRPGFDPTADQLAVFLTPGGHRICASAVGVIVISASKRAGIERRVTSHCLRHTAASHLMWAGASLQEVCEFLGHASVHVTAGYCRVGKWGAWKKEVVEEQAPAQPAPAAPVASKEAQPLAASVCP